MSNLLLQGIISGRSLYGISPADIRTYFCPATYLERRIESELLEAFKPALRYVANPTQTSTQENKTTMNKNYSVTLVTNGFTVQNPKGEVSVFASAADLGNFFKAEKANAETVQEAREIVKAAQ